MPTTLDPNYQTIFLLILIAIVMAVVIVVMGAMIGPRRSGPIKDSPYESGMPVIGDARRRFNIRFYIVAMLFLLFDVEIVFLWPWAKLFHRSATGGPVVDPNGLVLGKGFLLLEMALFLGILLIGYLYAWKKGVFKWQ